MTLQKLIDMLTEFVDDGYDPETPVVICVQPNYPLRYDVAGITTNREPGDEDEEDESSDRSDCPLEIRLLATDGHPRIGSPYGDRNDWNRRRID